jgi:hypothetical protein
MRPETPTPRLPVFWLTALALFGTVITAGASADPVPQKEPLQCWWRTTTGAVRIAEPFALVLTCAITESGDQHVVVDQAKLSPDAIPLSPFEVLGGGSLSESQSGDQTFFQRVYRVRILTETTGADIQIPSIVVSYQLETASPASGQARGIERRHELPALPMRVVSLVPAEADDIREAAIDTFAAVDDAAFGASLYSTAGLVLIAVGAIGLVVALLTGFRARQSREGDPGPLEDRLILRHVDRELRGIRAARERDGWTPDVVARALASTRVVAGYVTGRPPSMRTVDAHGDIPEGALVHSDRRGRRTLISSTLTAAALQAARRDENTDRTAIREALAELTRAHYGREKPPNPAPLDAGLNAAVAALDEVKHEHAWTTRLQAAAEARYRAIRIPWFR